MKKKLLALVLVVVLGITSVVGGTMAYLQDTDEAVNVMTLGNVYIEQIEQERDTNGALVDFIQAKPLYPAVYKGEAPNASIPWDTAENWAVADNEAWKTVDKTSTNVVDKFVTVTNTGDSDAYVRTIIAYEGEAINGTDIHVIHNSVTSSNEDVAGEFAATEYIENVMIDGIRYDVIVYTYAKPLAARATTIPSLKQVYMDKGCGNDDVAKYGTTYDILVLSQAIQTEGFPDAETALNSGFGNVAENAAEWFKDLAPENVSGDEAAAGALTEDKENIVIVLESDVTYDVAAWAENEMGGASTKTITIYGNGHTINFNQTNSDWSNIVTNNNATLVIEDAHVTNSGHNDGPWNRHDLNFACDVVLKNVTSDKAMAFKAGASLTNVTIDDANTSDTYAIWIQPNGQTVTLEGCTIDMLDATDGRGIKIDEQYVDAPEKVTLSVSNTKFYTEEKAAILVKSAAGADIYLNNVDISNVAADPINAVWVDEASKEYADLVKVTNGKAPVNEDDVKNLTDGLYQVNDTYYVTNANGLSYFSAKALTGNNGTAETATIEIMADIDMAGASFSAVVAQRGDTLTVNGNGHTISNVKVVSGVDDNSTGQASMFYAYGGSTLNVSDLTLSNITVTSDADDSGYAAAVVGYCEGTAILNNVDVVNATVTGAKSSGVLVGHLSGSLTATDCDVSGTVTLTNYEADGHYAGKYIGTLASTASLNNCTADVTVDGNLKTVNNGDIYGRNLGALTVNGATYVSNSEQLTNAVAAGKTNLYLMPGEYDVASCGGKTLTISGTKAAVIKHHNEGEDGMDYGFDGSTVTLNGVTIDTSASSGNYRGYARMNAVYNNCEIIGTYTTSSGSHEFNNCKFDTKNGYIWTWGATAVTFNGCEFGTNSKAILAHGGASTVITIHNCTFAATEKGYTGSGDNTAAVEIDPTGSNTYTINFTGENTKTESYAGWTRIKDGSTGHIITGVNN